MRTRELTSGSICINASPGNAYVQFFSKAENDGMSNRDFRRHISANLAYHMRQPDGGKMSGKELARLSGMPNSTVSRAERGTVTTSLEKLAAMADALGVEVWRLLLPDGDTRPLPEWAADLGRRLAALYLCDKDAVRHIVVSILQAEILSGIVPGPIGAQMKDRVDSALDSGARATVVRLSANADKHED